MSAVAIPGAAASVRPRLRAAGRIVLVGAAIGVLGQLLFFDVGLGVNVVVMVAALLLAAWRLRVPGTRIALADAWLAPAALLLAAFVALRGDAAMVAADTLAALALTGAAMPALAGIPVFTLTLAPIARLAVRFIGWVVASAAIALSDVRAVLPASVVRRRASRALPVVRGLFIAVPLVVVFAALFASADAVFARLAGDLLDVELDLGDLPMRLALGAVIAWLAMGALAFTVGARPEAEAPAAGSPLMGGTEALTVLVALDALFALFVGLQAAYLFGGLDTLAAAGMTYADYARRGFFELCAAAALVGGVVLAMEALVRRRSRAYLVAAVGLTVLTIVVLASAALRLGLYQHAYGWTELRFWVAGSIGWLAIGLVLLGAALATHRSRWMPHALLAAAVVVGLAMNVIGPVRFVAEQNVARAADPSLVPPNGESGLDASYLGSLDVDAVEPLIAALPRLAGADRRMVEQLLVNWRGNLEAAGSDAWQEWNLSRGRARDALAQLP